MKKLTLLLALLIYLAAGPALYAQQLTIQADAGKQILSRTDIEGLPHVKVTASEHSSGPVGFEGVTLKSILEKAGVSFGESLLARLHALIPAHVQLASEPFFLVEFGSAPEKILETATAWNANLIVLGLHRVQDASRRQTTWAKAYEIVCKANCPVLTVRAPE